jgi:hypothetical protein
MSILTIFRWPKDAVMSFNESWFWYGQGSWTTPAVLDRNQPRLQIIKATLWQRWLLWLMRHLRFVGLILVLLTIGISMATAIKQADGAAPSPEWTEPIEPPGVVLVTHNSAAALASHFKAPPRNDSAHKPVLLAPERRPAPTKASASQQPVLKSDAATQVALEQVLQAWSLAWQEKNVPAYLAHYDEDFVPPKGQSRQVWAQMRTQRIQSKRGIHHEMRHVWVSLTGTQAHVSFEQRYADERLNQIDQKTMLWIWRKGQWRIARETTS